MISINFDNPWWFFLIVPIVAICVVPFVMAVRKDNRNGHNTASLILHLVLAVIIGFTAAGTGVEVVATETDVYVLADVSYSAHNNLDTVDNYIADLKDNLPRNSKMGVICFGKDYELLTPLGGKVTSVKNSIVNKSETNAAGAMEYAGTLFRDDVIKRIVLITDGGESDKRDNNVLKRAADSLRADNIKIDAIWLDDNLSETDREVQISGVEFTQYTYRGHSERARVDIMSSFAGTVPVTVTLLKNGDMVSERAEVLSAGNNTVIFPLDTEEAGTRNYEVSVKTTDPAHDDCRLNNNYQFTQTVSDALNVLLLTESAEDRKEVEALYAGDERVKVDSYYITDQRAPYSIEDLCAYDEIVISNADICKHPHFALFTESLDTAVSLFGKSLVTIGDLSIQTRTDLALKQLEDMLPVKFGNDDRDPKLYTIVIDVSRSMELEGRLSRARAAAEQLIKLLNDEDEIAIVHFYGDSEILQSPIKASYRDEVIKKLDTLKAVQGTFIASGLRQAYDMIKDAAYREKQVMLISDGLNYTDENSLDPIAIVQDMRNAGIQTSVVDIGRGMADDTVAKKAKELLETIAADGLGQYYYVNNEAAVENVIFGEFTNDQTESVLEGNYSVNIEKKFDGAVQNIKSLSHVSGFVYSGAKASADTVLTVNYTKSNGRATKVPLYAHWGYGNGNVATFTGGIDSNWLSGWNAVEKKTFFRNVMDDCIPDEKIDYPFTVETELRGGFARLEITPPSLHAGASAEIAISLPDGEELIGKPTFTSSSYVYEFALPDTGAYGVKITYTYGNKDYTADASFAVPYKAEYNLFEGYDSAGLYRAIGGFGTVSEDGKLVLKNDDSEVRKYEVNLTVPLLIVCVLIFLADVVVRKLKWADIKSLFVKVGKEKKHK